MLQADEAGGPVRAAYHDRLRSPRDTVAMMRPFFAELGITRVARQTGLDRLGIACFAAIRPNSCSIATNQGKGIDDDAAEASAVMEAVEYAIAERPHAEVLRASAANLEQSRRLTWDPRKMLPLGERLDGAREIDWLPGRRLGPNGADDVLVPFDAVTMSGARRDLPLICQSTNGLAAGNDADEANFHAVCELIERDAATLWSLLPPAQRRHRCVSDASFGDALITGFCERFGRADLVIRLFDQTTDLGIPTILAVTGPARPAFARHFDIATGAGTHPDPARAALRAITEAAQTRVTSIAGARDDVRPDLYRVEGADEAFDLLAAGPQPLRLARPPHLSRQAGRLLEDLLATLAGRGVDDLVSVPLGGARYGISVVHVVSELLEDRGPNANWRPGRRALDMLAAVA